MAARRAWRWALGLLLLLLLLRLCLAFLIKTGANHVLENLEGYRGHTERVRLSLWRGAYRFSWVEIRARDQGSAPPLFSAQEIDIGLQWEALFHGQVAASILLRRPEVNFVAAPPKGKAQTGAGQDWTAVARRLVPIEINRLRVRDGAVHYQDPYAQPPLDVRMDTLQAELRNLRSRPAPGQALPASLAADARLQGAPVSLKLRLDAFAAKPTFEYAFELRKLDLKELNTLLRHTLGLDVHRGEFSLFSEGRSELGRFKGYVKPLILDLDVMAPGEKLTPTQAFKEAGAGLLGWIFKNHPKDQAGLKLDVEGDLSDPNTKPWRALLSLLKNAFVKPLPAKLESEMRPGWLPKKAE
jgi:hypothetical protein